MSLFECFDQIVTTVLSVDLLLSWWTSTGTQSLSSPKTALNLIRVGGRKVVVSLKNNFGTVKCLCHTQLHCVCAVALMSICPLSPSHAVRRSAGVCTSADWGALENVSLAADFDQVPSFGLGDRFPDTIACCGNRKWKVSRDTRVSLERSHLLHFYVWPPPLVWVSWFTQCS